MVDTQRGGGGGISRSGSQLSRANIGLAENYSDSWTALVESERIQNCKRQIFGFDEAEDIYIGHVLHRISPRHPLHRRD